MLGFARELSRPSICLHLQTLVPLPQPGLGYQPGGSYKVQLSINAEQLVTPWLPVLGLAVPPLVYVDVELARTGGEIASLRATVRTMPPDSPHARDAAAALWQNATHWPKPLRVYYTWQAGPEVHEERALLFLLGAAVVALALVARNAHRAYRSQLAAFVARVARPPEPKGD